MPLARYIGPLTVEPALPFLRLVDGLFEFLLLSVQFRKHSRNLGFHRELPGFKLPLSSFDFLCALFFLLPVNRFLSKPGSTGQNASGADINIDEMYALGGQNEFPDLVGVQTS